MRTQVRFDIARRLEFAGGHSFGDAGPYERLVGRAHFALDPLEPANANIVDLEHAPRNDRGLVEFSADLDILKPVDLDHSNRRVLYDVNNRGNKTALNAFNSAPRVVDPITLEHAGNGFLMRRGYTVVWSGWQGDLLPVDGLLTADLPEARENGNPLRGTVRQEFIADDEAVLCMPVSGARVIRCYPVVHPAGATLTVRERETDARRPVPREEWAFEEIVSNPATGAVRAVPSRTHLRVKTGFRPGWIYELVYETEGSRVMGLGIVGIRDLLSFLRYEDTDAGGRSNPLAGHVEKAYAYGASLSARVIRQFLYDGYNADPAGRRVFDAVYPHVSGGGRLFANMRFAQVGRFPRQHEEHQWPSERYPFAYSPVPDLFSEQVDSVLKRPESDPLVMHTHTSTEYWQRHASLGHTDPRTGEDVDIPDTVRLYVLGGAQHAGATPPEGDVCQQPPNVMSTSPFLRACLALMDAWATRDAPPPPSRLPRRSDGSLAPPEEVLARFPKIPGVNLPESPSRLPRYDYGPDFDRPGSNLPDFNRKAIVTEHPPRALPGQEYPVQLPQVNADGNEIAGLLSPEVTAPIGTHTGWNLRKRGFAEGDLFSLSGSFIPFARTRAEREATGDPRLSIEERYPTHGHYVRAVAEAAHRLVEDGLLLEEDEARYVDAAKRRDPLDTSVPLAPLDLGGR